MPQNEQDKRRNGTFRADRNQKTGKLPVEMPVTPVDLKPTASAFFQTIARQAFEAGLISKVDSYALRLLSETWCIYLDCIDEIDNNGLMLCEHSREGHDRYRENPAVKIRDRTFSQLMRGLKDFGFVPSARGLDIAFNDIPDEEEERVMRILGLSSGDDQC